ncbi:hypothetical protein INT44_003498 [Umbelopsis vinacea]|uniref:Homeobox domain-containing protein n=2 Tax=Umbelopsis TaxID=64561 RepID=A0A8H7PTW6_9FUNG|nr:hypothetical protein INT44_003498 [Umbelopsis vinacea]
MSFPNVSSSIAAAAAAAAVSQGSDDLSSSTIYTNTLFDTFHQMPHGDFKPTFYNPFEIKHRRRTSRAQFKVLERTFMENPKPSAAVRRILAQKLNMTPRGVQVWFQNRRAKAKLQKQQDEKQRLEGSLQDDPVSPASSGLGYSSPSSSSQGSLSSPSKETKKPQNEDMYSAFSAKMSFSQTANNLLDDNASLSPRFRADGNAWFNFPSSDFQTHQFNNLMSATSPIEHSAPGPMRGNNMRCRPTSNYSIPYNAGLLRRKSCPGDLINTMYANMANANREKLQDIPEDVVPNNFLADNMNCYMNSMQMRGSRRMSEPCISNYSVAPNAMANPSFSPLLCRAFSINSPNDQQNSVIAFQPNSPPFELQSQLNDFDLTDENNNCLSSNSSVANDHAHPLDSNSVDSINLQMNSFDLVNTPVSLSMSI